MIDEILNELDVTFNCPKCKKQRHVKMIQMENDIPCECGHLLHKKRENLREIRLQMSVTADGFKRMTLNH